MVVCYLIIYNKFSRKKCLSCGDRVGSVL